MKIFIKNNIKTISAFVLLITFYTAHAVYLNSELEEAREPSQIELQKGEYDMLREEWTIKQERIKRIDLQIEQLHISKQETIKEKLQLEPKIQKLRFEMTWKK